jgi:hypothetical protein
MARLTPLKRLTRLIEQAEFRRQFRQELLEAREESPACPLHPHWKPARGIQPTPPRSMCPSCVAEATRAHEVVTLEVEHSSDRGNTPRLQAWWDAYLDRLADEGVLLPGSDDERAILASVDERRRDENQRNHQRSAYTAVTQRIEGGKIIMFGVHRDKRVRRREGLVRI